MSGMEPITESGGGSNFGSQQNGRSRPFGNVREGCFIVTVLTDRSIASISSLRRSILSAAVAIAATTAAPALAGDATATTAASIGAVDAVSNAALGAKSDPMFRSLFDSWKRMDAVPQGFVSVPSQKPVKEFRYTSTFGVRSDPFQGSARMHAGLDMAAPLGTPVFATADGIVGRAERTYGGYGNLVQIEHGKGLETRYGHLSQILVRQGQRVHRGDLIALMGSTGRSTGSHLHYEVRIDGHAVNPTPFLQSADYLMALQTRQPFAPAAQTAMGGPADDAGDQD